MITTTLKAHSAFLLVMVLSSAAFAQCPSQRAAVMPNMMPNLVPRVMPRPTYPVHRVLPMPVVRTPMVLPRRMPAMPVMRPAVKQVSRYAQPRPAVNATPVAAKPAPPKSAPPRPAPPQPNVALQLVEQAKEAFRNKQVDRSIQLMDRVIKLKPKSAAAYQFRAMAHFAAGDYDRGAADVYDTLLLGPMWNWNAIAPLYASTADYEAQYKSLATAAAEDQDSMSKHFLLAYHHLALGHMMEGKEELNKVLSIKPEEPLTKKLLETVSDSEKLASK